ncbi:MAG: hypothetical protein J6I49_07395, partial [Bacteroidales bacterium]|nr:hypothetical protein [Bacteroidales bacterium]
LIRFNALSSPQAENDCKSTHFFQNHQIFFHIFVYIFHYPLIISTVPTKLFSQPADPEGVHTGGIRGASRRF